MVLTTRSFGTVPVNPTTFKDKGPIVLSKVSASQMVGLLLQIGQISEYAADLFHNLYTEASHTSERIHSLTQRTQSVENQLTAVDETFKTTPPSLFYNTTADVNWKRADNMSHSFFSSGTRPAPIEKVRQMAYKPPNVSLMSDLCGRDCSKVYSDPDFFFRQWTEEEMKKMNDSAKIGQKVKRKRNKKNKAPVEVEGIEIKVYSGQGAEFGGPVTQNVTGGNAAHDAQQRLQQKQQQQLAQQQQQMQKLAQLPSTASQPTYSPQPTHTQPMHVQQPAPQYTQPTPVFKAPPTPSQPRYDDEFEAPLPPSMPRPQPPQHHVEDYDEPEPQHTQVYNAPPAPVISMHAPPAPMLNIPAAPALDLSMPQAPKLDELLAAAKIAPPSAPKPKPAPPQPDGRGDLMSQISKGLQLKKVAPTAAVEKPKEVGLLSEIKGGFKLKKAAPVVKKEEPAGGPAGLGAVMDILARRRAIQADSSEDDDDDDWD